MHAKLGLKFHVRNSDHINLMKTGVIFEKMYMLHNLMKFALAITMSVIKNVLIKFGGPIVLLI